MGKRGSRPCLCGTLPSRVTPPHGRTASHLSSPPGHPWPGELSHPWGAASSGLPAAGTSKMQPNGLEGDPSAGDQFPVTYRGPPQIPALPPRFNSSPPHRQSGGRKRHIPRLPNNGAPQYTTRFRGGWASPGVAYRCGPAAAAPTRRACRARGWAPPPRTSPPRSGRRRWSGPGPQAGGK